MIPRCQNILNRSCISHRFFSTADTVFTAEDAVRARKIPPKDARVVVCGGGVMGASVAYHLGQLGWGPETVLIEQNRYKNVVILKIFDCYLF